MNKYIEYKDKKLSIILIILIFVLSLVASYLYISHVREVTYQNITELSEQTVILIRLIISLIIFCLIIIGFITITSIYSISTTQKRERKVFNIAYIDSVTSLGNETFFRENGAVFLKKEMDKNKYIITIDINKFKVLNKIYGYSFSNKILKELGKKIKEILPENNIICRVSNDIFASVFIYEKDIHDLLNKIYKEASVLYVEDIEIKLNLSIGAYNIAPEETDINNVLDKAYLARSQTKGVYNNNYYLFDEKLENKLIEEQALESDMEQALNEKEFVVVYQPKIYTKDEKMAGAEALVRWCKDGELIPPSKFIPLFEKNKFILKLDIYVFERVCQDLAEWKERFGTIPIVSINVSKEHFVDENFIEKYVSICNKYNIKPKQIDLEITESATIDGNIDILKVLTKIKEKGFIISLDDFGTGYSSLSMIQNMPIDVIKVDKVFVDKADLNSYKNIINYIMYIAESLGVKTVVEGVETEEQAKYIKKIKGDMIQGYYYSKPMSKEEFEEYFNKNI